VRREAAGGSRKVGEWRTNERQRSFFHLESIFVLTLFCGPAAPPPLGRYQTGALSVCRTYHTMLRSKGTMLYKKIIRSTVAVTSALGLQWEQQCTHLQKADDIIRHLMRLFVEGNPIGDFFGNTKSLRDDVTLIGQ